MVHCLGRFDHHDTRPVSVAADKNEILEFSNLIDQDLSTALLPLAIRAWLVRLDVGRRNDVTKIGMIVGNKPVTRGALAASIGIYWRLAEQAGGGSQGKVAFADALRPGQQQRVGQPIGSTP